MDNFSKNLKGIVEVALFDCDNLVQSLKRDQEEHKQIEENRIEKIPISDELSSLMSMLIGDYHIHASIFYSLKHEYCSAYQFVYEAARDMLFKKESSDMPFITLLLRMNRYFYAVDYKQHGSEFIMNMLLYFCTSQIHKLMLVKEVAENFDLIVMPHHHFVPPTPDVIAPNNSSSAREKLKLEENYRPFRPLNIINLVLQIIYINFDESLYRGMGTSVTEITKLVVEKIDKMIADMIENMKVKKLYKDLLQETFHHLETINSLHNIIIEMCKDKDKYISLFSDNHIIRSYFNLILREQSARLDYRVRANAGFVKKEFSPYLSEKAKEYHKNTIYKYMLLIHYGMHIPDIDEKWICAAAVLANMLKDSLRCLEPIRNLEQVDGFCCAFTEMILERTFALFAVAGIHLTIRAVHSTVEEMSEMQAAASMKISIRDADPGLLSIDADTGVRLAAAFCRSIGLMKEGQREVWVNLV